MIDGDPVQQADTLLANVIGALAEDAPLAVRFQAEGGAEPQDGLRRTGEDIVALAAAMQVLTRLAQPGDSQ